MVEYSLQELSSSGIAVTASYAFNQSSRLLKVRCYVSCGCAELMAQNVDNDDDRKELLALQRRLDRKIQVC